MTRKLAEVYPLALYLCEEMEARGWTTDDVARRMGGDFGINALALGFLLFVHEDGLIVGDEMFGQLAFAFDVSEELFRNLDAAWRTNPDARVPFDVPDGIIGPAGVGEPPTEH